jgi:hypothetical protein
VHPVRENKTTLEHSAGAGQGCPPQCWQDHARFWSRCYAGAVPSTRAADAFVVRERGIAEDMCYEI